jgi:hypothetical protein
MAHYEGSAPSRIFYGWWIAAAFSLIIFLSTGIRFAYGPAFGVSCALLIVGAGLSLTINMAGRPRVRAVLQPVAGGR